jgi:predicted phage tail protein
MQLIFHGILRSLYGPTASIEAESVADAIEGFSRQHPNWPRNLLIEVIGHDTEEKLRERPAEVQLMPAMLGGGGKFTSILIGAAMIGLAFATGGVSFTATGALTATSLGGSLLIGGAMMILQGIVGLFMKAPRLGKNNDPEASKYLAVNKNTTAVNTPITCAWGRIDLGGHWLSLQSDSNNLSFGVFPTNPT